MHNNLEFFNLIESQLLEVQGYIDAHLNSLYEPVNQLFEHVNTNSGKMLRPGLVLLSGLCCGEILPVHITVAAITEMVHDATLLHDDVIDEADTRRGHKTVNSKWNNLISILMGDFFFAKSFRLLVSTKCPELMERVSKTTEIVSFGELRQIEECGNFDLSEDAYLDIISAKTASLFSTSAVSGALLNNASSREINRLSSFGENVGISFQIADDLLDDGHHRWAHTEFIQSQTQKYGGGQWLSRQFAAHSHPFSLGMGCGDHIPHETQDSREKRIRKG